VGLSDITGVFSRYFIVGFFMPAYVALIALWLTASQGFIPDTLTSHAEGTQLVILGGVALVLALLLSGLNYPLTRWAEGYPLMRLRGPVVKLVPTAAVTLQRWSYDRLADKLTSDKTSEGEKARAEWQLDQLFPKDKADLLPTRIGNAMRAYEQHSNNRWGLDGVTSWPRIQALLSDGERESLVDAKIDLYVFLNAAFLALGVAVCLVVDRLVHKPATSAWLYLIPFAVAYLLYRAAIGPAVRRGAYVRSGVDLHRLELYEKLGFRKPASLSEEKTIGERISQLLLYGDAELQQDWWAAQPTTTGADGATDERAKTLLELIEEWMRR
jgi:hypothetical protein